MRRPLACLILPLALLAGCGAVAVHFPDGTHAEAVTLFKDPSLKNFHYASTQATVDVGDYSSLTKMTGAEFGSLVATVVKLLIAIP